VEFLFAALVVGSLFTAVQVALAEADRRRARWRAGLAALCARWGPSRDGDGARGAVGGLEVRCEPPATWSGSGRLVVVVGPVGLGLAPRRGSELAPGATGDEAFDATWVVDGDPWGPARLSADLRRRLSAFAGRLVLTPAGELRVDVALDPAADELGALLALAEDLRTPLEPAIASAELARHDPHSGVRARAAERLLAAPPTSDLRLASLAAGIAWTPRQRAAWARREGEAGRAALRELSTHADPSVACPATLGLAALAHPESEPGLPAALVRLVEVDPAVIEVLAAIGTPDALPALQRVAERSPLVDARATAARAAIERIRARVVAGPGAVSLAPGASGAVSVVAPNVRGALATAAAERSGPS
jgi:hypothetical protein